jgi:hypothetical protein
LHFVVSCHTPFSRPLVLLAAAAAAAAAAVVQGSLRTGCACHAKKRTLLAAANGTVMINMSCYT